MASITLDRFDEVVGGATNDEVIELAIRVFEDLAERVGTATEHALRPDGNEYDRDLLNEAFTLAETVDRLVPNWFSKPPERVKQSSRYISDRLDQLEKAIAVRGEEGSVAQWGYVPQSPAARRVEAKKRERDEAKTRELLATLDLSPESVFEAMRFVAATGENVQALDVALALCPDLEPTDAPGRQAVVNRVGMAIRHLARDGRVVKTRGAARNRTCRWALAEDDDA